MITRRNFLKICASSLAGTYFLRESYYSQAAAQEIPVLLYHRVGYTKDHLTVTPERFNRDLISLRENGYKSISLPQFQSFMAGQAAGIPDNPVLITFDDGYADNYDNAYFSLLNYGMKASFFIITGLLWTPGRLSPENIREMYQNGMSFGSHTLNHRPLAGLAPAEAEEELNSSRSTLESILGVTIDSIAYPCGSYNYTTIKTAMQGGYRFGFTVTSGTCSPGTPPFELRRIPIFDYDPDIITVINEKRYC